MIWVHQIDGSIWRHEVAAGLPETGQARLAAETRHADRNLLLSVAERLAGENAQRLREIADRISN